MKRKAMVQDSKRKSKSVYGSIYVIQDLSKLRGISVQTAFVAYRMYDKILCEKRSAMGVQGGVYPQLGQIKISNF